MQQKTIEKIATLKQSVSLNETLNLFFNQVNIGISLHSFNSDREECGAYDIIIDLFNKEKIAHKTIFVHKSQMKNISILK